MTSYIKLKAELNIIINNYKRQGVNLHGAYRQVLIAWSKVQ